MTGGSQTIKNNKILLRKISSSKWNPQHYFHFIWECKRLLSSAFSRKRNKDSCELLWVFRALWPCSEGCSSWCFASLCGWYLQKTGVGTEHGQSSYSSTPKMPATETGETLGRITFRTWPKSPKNTQLLDPGRESLREYIKWYFFLK